jgi:glycosyltransferase involved in cell wall biosynthesis
LKVSSHPSILIIGALPDPLVSESVGGTTVLLKSLVDYLDRQKISYGFVKSNPYFGRGATIRNALSALGGILREIRHHDYILVNCSRNGAFYFAPLVFLITRLAGKKIAFRAFGGDLREIMEEAPPLLRWLFERTVLRSDLVFVETKRLVRFLLENRNCTNVFWLPNSRSSCFLPTAERYRKRFVFISHVKRSKGILQILEASAILGSDYTIDVYGPIMDAGLSEADFVGLPVQYKGALPVDQVRATLALYDFLLLPTFFAGEGYPGIIIEGYSLGVPCITTHWKSIPEIVDDGRCGLLIEPRSTAALVEAIRSIEEPLFQKLREGAKAQFAEFEADEVNARFLAAFR